VKRRSRKSSAREFDLRRLPKIVLLGAAAVLLGWMVFKTSAFNALFRDNPAAAAAIAPDDPRFAFALAQAQVMQNRGIVTPEAAAATRAATARAPLADEPFLIEALEALVRRDNARAERLLIEARARNPRARTVRLILLDRYMRSGRAAEAAEEIAVLNRLIPAASNLLVPELAKFARNPSTRPALTRALRSDPMLAGRVLTHLASTGAEPELVTSLAATVPVPVNGERPWQDAMVASLVSAGEIDRAATIWSRLPGVRRNEGLVYDPRFEGWPGPPPFNWKLTHEKAGVAERGQAGGLQVEFYGREPASLASQLIRLPPGSYRLAARVEGDASGERARLAWRVVCGGGNAELVSVALRNVTYAPRVVGADFTVPGGCGVQTLRLDGVASEFPEAQSVTVTEIAIRKAGRP
jgi:hypothetical protein